MPDARYGPGTVLRGKYRVERVIGEGGMGVVVLATHLKLGQPVAVKVLRPAATGRGPLVARFAREARAVARLRNEHVVRVLDVDETEDGAPFLVMEYLVGVDLETLLRRDGVLAPERAVDYVLQACEGVGEAHALGIIHRDLKPANLFVVRTDAGADVVKVLDFGIAKAKADDDLSLTATDSVVGSPSYMSPEQIKRSSDVGVGTDIWSLGVVLYQLVSGRVPFEASNATSLGALIASEPPRPLGELRGDLPDRYLDVVARCLRKSEGDRFGSVVELARALADVSGTPEAADRVSRVVRAAAKRLDPTDEPGDGAGALPRRITVDLSEAPAPSLDEPAAGMGEGRAPAPPVVSAKRTGHGRILAAVVVAAAAVAMILLARGQGDELALRTAPRAAGADGAPVATMGAAATRTATVAATIDDAGVGFDDLTFAPAIGRVLVPAGKTGQLVLLDPETRAVEGVDGFSRSESWRGGHTQGATSSTAAGALVAVVDRTARSVSLVDPAARRIVASHPLAAVPDYVRFEPQAGELWVTEPDAERIEVFTVDFKRLRLDRAQTIEVPGGPEYLIFHPPHAYTNQWHGMTSRIDLRTKRVHASFANGCEGSRTLALDDVRVLLFVGCVEGTVTSIDLSHGDRIVGRFDYHAGIDALVYDAVRGVLYAPSAAAGRMAGLVIDREGQPTLAFEVSTAKGAACATVDGSGRVWICDPAHGSVLMAPPPVPR